MSQKTVEAVVIGGGVTGCSIAYHLTRHGLTDVCIIEKESLASGATGICPGGIRQQFEGEADCRLAQYSVRFWEKINDFLRPEEPFRFERSGYLFLADSNDMLETYKRNVAMQNRLGIPSHVLSREEIADFLPHLQCEALAGGAFCGEDGFIEDCHGVTTAFAQEATRGGAQILFEEVTSLKPLGNSWEVITTRSRLECRAVVLAAGVDSVSLASAVGVSLPVRRERRRLAFTEPYGSLVMLPLVVAPERGFAGKQLTYGVFYLGWLGEKESDDDLSFLERSLQAGASLLPLLEELPVRRVLAGNYDITPDHRPILGASGVDHLYLAVGFSGHGFMIAPAVGEILAQMVRGEATTLPVEPFSLSRFSGDVKKEGLVI